MPKANWFTPNPFLVELGISSSNWFTHRRGFPLMKYEARVKSIDDLEPTFKQNWMKNSIYKLIMLSKTTVIVKPELLATSLLFWNSGTNTFDFRLGPMSPTILDMAQVVGLRPSGRVINITHNWTPLSRPTTENSNGPTPITHLEYNSATFKSCGTSFTGFILFVKKTFRHSSYDPNRD